MSTAHRADTESRATNHRAALRHGACGVVSRRAAVDRVQRAARGIGAIMAGRAARTGGRAARSAPAIERSFGAARSWYRRAMAKKAADELEAHNALRVLAGLPVVDAIARPDPELDTAAKMRRIHGKTSAMAVIEVLYQGEGPQPPSGTIVHWWGQFSDELPAPFRLAHGGHGYLEARDLAHAARLLKKIRDAVLAMQPKGKRKKTKEWAGVSDDGRAWYRWMLGDDRQMTLEFKRASQLTASEKREKPKRPR
jgi:hypothetical protein